MGVDLASALVREAPRARHEANIKALDRKHRKRVDG
jgi:hypothetical protein